MNQKQTPTPPGVGPDRKRSRDIGFYILLAVIILAVCYTIFTDSSTTTDRLDSYSELVSLFKSEKVESFKTEGNEIILQVREGSETVEKSYSLYSFSVFWEDFHELINEQYEKGIIKEYDYTEGFTLPWWASFLPYLLIMGGVMVLWYFMMNKAGGGPGGFTKFSKARTRNGAEGKDKKTFDDVAGCEEEKKELQEIVDFLKDPQKFTDMGARIPKGVLMVGPPGNGKTLLAKAVAGEADVPFLSISGSDFVELYVGVGAGRVRDLFDQAKKLAPAIIFIDEIDAVGRQRGSGLGGGHDEREQTLNQLLVEMDGFGNNEGVIVMAATNRADILDAALLRPGRFDRQVYVGYPDIKGREQILEIYAEDKHLSPDVDLNSIAKGTVGFSGADLENLLNEAAILAVRRDSDCVCQEDIDEAILKVQMGPAKKSKKMSEKSRKLTAYHESGHAISGHYLEHCDPIHYITIIPRGSAGGFTLTRPANDLENFSSKCEMYDHIVMCLGGRMAEKLFLDDISSGASGDIQMATGIARDMVTKFGMSDRLGPILYDSSDHSIFIGRDFGTTKSYSEETAAIIDEEVKALFDDAAKDCEKILQEHGDELIQMAEQLLVCEYLDSDDLDYFFEHGEFMTEEQKTALTETKRDETIEKPAKKVSKFGDDEPKKQRKPRKKAEPKETENVPEEKPELPEEDEPKE